MSPKTKPGTTQSKQQMNCLPSNIILCLPINANDQDILERDAWPPPRRLFEFGNYGLFTTFTLYYSNHRGGGKGFLTSYLFPLIS